MSPGPAALLAVAGALGIVAAFGAVIAVLYRRECTTRIIGPQPDPLRYVVPPPVPGDLDLLHVPVGEDEYGAEVTLPLLGNHILVAGVTGAGKGSALWSLLLGAAPGVADGTVSLWGADPKGGMELGIGRPLFDVFTTTPEDAADMLEEAVALMERRATSLASLGVRVHHPTEFEPLVVVALDEIASLTADAEAGIRRRVEKSIRLLVRMGRAVGFSVIACTQDPRKEVLGFRGLFPTRVCLRVVEPDEVDMVLGRGAREAGAEAHRIPRRHRGIGYLLDADTGRVTRLRFPYYTDAKIRALAAKYGQQEAA